MAPPPSETAPKAEADPNLPTSVEASAGWGDGQERWPLIYPMRPGHPPIVQIRADAEHCSDCSVFGLFGAQCSEHLNACLVAEPDTRYLVPGT